MIYNPEVQVGDRIYDCGCRVHHHPFDFKTLPPIECMVARVFDWGLRVHEIGNPSNEWDVMYWNTDESYRKMGISTRHPEFVYRTLSNEDLS